MKIICPQCGSRETVPILYGLPTAEAWREEEEGKILLGGCCPERFDRHCKACGHEWESQGDLERGNNMGQAQSPQGD